MAAFNNADPMNLLPNGNDREYDSEVCLLLYHLDQENEVTEAKLETLLKKNHKKMFEKKLMRLN